MKIRFASLAILLALLGAFAVAPFSASAQNASTIPSVPVSGSEHGRSFDGTFTITRFIARGHQLLAEGTLAGTFTNRAGNEKSIDRTLRLPVTAVTQEATGGAVRAQAGSCEVLFLQIGPIELRLLGLHLDIDTITIDLTAVPSEGLLGQLLCGLAGGLDLSQLQQLANLLNQLLGLLG